MPSARNGKVALVVRVSPECRQLVNILAAQQGRPASHLTEQAVSEYIARQYTKKE